MLSGRYFLSYLLFAQIAVSLAFQSPALISKSSSSCRRSMQQSPSFVQLQMSLSDDESSSSSNLVEETPSVPTTTEASAVSTPPVVATEEAAPYPINLPSPILLASSIFLSIASIGSIFDLTTKSADIPLGFGPTAAIALFGVPASLFLFFAAIQKGKAETEEDDKEFRKNK